jgi:hypothetical protein
VHLGKPLRRLTSKTFSERDVIPTVVVRASEERLRLSVKEIQGAVANARDCFITPISLKFRSVFLEIRSVFLPKWRYETVSTKQAASRRRKEYLPISHSFCTFRQSLSLRHQLQ